MRFVALMLTLALGISAKAQIIIKGKVTEAITGEPVEEVQIKQGDKIAKTNVTGTYELEVSKGKIWIEASKIGFVTDSVEVEFTADGTYEVNFVLEQVGTQMEAIQITASVARDRKTPIAFTNVSGRKISENLGSQDMPMVLNNTPGVYATQQGGGSGDARITIRGFNQRNIAVMIDGIPVNDMENGQVYWSNWFGLNEVTAITQVQRGLGSSRIANPAVGGTLNIITRGVLPQMNASINQEFGDSKYQKTSLTFNSGMLKGNWGFVFSVTQRNSAGYVDQLYDRMFSYYARVQKNFGRQHVLSFTAVGAPQSHGQRTFKARLSLYDRALAQKLGMDTALAGMPLNQGRKYNQHWGAFREGTISQDRQDTVWGRYREQNERENMFHKPQFYLKHDWKVSGRMLVSSTGYMSVGRGGGTQALKVSQVPNVYGQYDFQSVYLRNTSGTSFVSPIDPVYHPTLRKSGGILQRNVNNHNWYGFLSTVNYKLNKQTQLSGGIDGRWYEGIHYREVYDLLGGDYYRPDARDTNPLATSRLYRKGDIFAFNYTGKVRWLGMFGEWEYSKKNLSAFVNASYSMTGYQRIDYFKVDANKNPLKSAVVNLQGFTLKTGANYNLSKSLNVFMNVGHLNRPARFNNVFDNRNIRVANVKNEIVNAFEAGMGYRSPIFSADVNTYYTVWNNRPLDFLPSFVDRDGNTFSYNINGLSARHMGIEIAASVQPLKGLRIETAIGLADWIWTSGAQAVVNDERGDSVGFVDFDATGVHVGDAAQQQFSVLVRYEPNFLKGFYVQPNFIYFAKHFADFEPTALVGNYERRESFKIPNYWFVNMAFGYGFKASRNYRVTVYGNVQNITSNFYITDAEHRLIGGAAPSTTFNPKNLEVFVSPGMRFTFGVRVHFQ